MFALLLVAASLGLSNFAAAIGIGVSGVDTQTRLRVGIIFGIFDDRHAGYWACRRGRSLPIVTLGHDAHWIGAALLIAISSLQLDPGPPPPPQPGERIQPS